MTLNGDRTGIAENRSPCVPLSVEPADPLLPQRVVPEHVALRPRMVVDPLAECRTMVARASHRTLSVPVES